MLKIEQRVQVPRTRHTNNLVAASSQSHWRGQMEGNHTRCTKIWKSGVRVCRKLRGWGIYAPIPITLPYSGWVSSACTAGGQKQRMARAARKSREREERRVLLCVRVGRRTEGDMVVEVQGTGFVGCLENLPIYLLPEMTCHLGRGPLT